MKILSINKTVVFEGLSISNIEESELSTFQTLASFDYIIINGGDGTIRRIIKILHTIEHQAKFILNPTGSFNVISKLHKTPKLKILLESLVKNKPLQNTTHVYYTLNNEIFLFSAGNMGDLQHIFLSETLRFGILEAGITKYLLAVFFLLPVHLVMTPFMLLSNKRFFIFTPASFISKIGSFYGQVKEEITINLKNEHNLLELDGDVVIIEDSTLHIKPAGHIEILTL